MKESDIIKTYKAGEIIYRQDDSGFAMYVVHEGKVKLFSEKGGKISEAELSKGDFFGELEVVDNGKRKETAKASTDCKLLEIDPYLFKKVLCKEPSIICRIIKRYVDRARNADWKPEHAVLKKADFTDKRIDLMLPIEHTSEKNLPLTAFFITQDGKRKFPILKAGAIIGRSDPSTGVPDIDLTPLDTMRTVSRKHAKLSCIKNKFYIEELPGVHNGTTVNGERLVPGKPVPLENHYVVIFGKVPLVFMMEK